MEDDLESLATRVESGELQTHDEIRREFLNIIEDYLQDEYGVLADVSRFTLERDIGSGYYDAAIGNLEFEIKSLDEGFQAGIDDAQDYVESVSDAPDFFSTEGIHGAHISPDGNVVESDDIPQLAPRLKTLLDRAVTEPTPDDIVNAFGPQSERVQNFIETIWEILQNHRDLERVKSAFDTWRDIYAESANLSSEARDAVQDQADQFGIDISSEDETYEFLFVVQTYFAIFLKLFATKLAGEYPSIEDRLERGTWPESFRRLSIEANIAEHDLFDWILDPARESSDASHKFEDIATRLASSIDFINPDEVNQDILRDLYQGSFDSTTRTAMGEFYTNDELVDEVLDELDYEGDSILEEATLLDPTCGSGTFLFHAIRRYVEAAESEDWTDPEIAEGVVENINGIDLHPFAVAMARTNYLLALGDRAEHVSDVPVYWTDSLATTTQQTINGQNVTVSTLGSVSIPDSDDISHRELFTTMERALEGEWSKNRFVGEFGEQDSQRYENTLESCYDFFTEEIHNGMWIPAFRDAAAVRELKDDCVYLVGNPPWVRRRNVAEGLRERLQRDFDYYDEPWRPDLTEMRNPPSPRDYAIAFLEAGFDFLDEGCDLGFVITSSLARAMYAGRARYALTDTKNLKSITDYTLAPHDFFPDADNKPLVVTAANEDPTGTASVCLYNRENNKRSWDIDPANLSLEEDDSRSPWILAPPTVVSAIRSMSGSRDRAGDRFTPTSGVKTAANDIFFVDDIDTTEDPNEVLVETQGGESVRIEEEVLRPVVRGRNIDEWEFDFETLIMWVYDDNGDVRSSLPDRLTEYLESHRSGDDGDGLENRRDALVSNQMDDGAPFWVFGNVNAEKLDAKVAWQDIAKTVETAYLPSKVDADLDGGIDLGQRELIPTTTLIFFEAMNDTVAKQLTGLLNSTPVRAYVGSYATRTGGRYCHHKAWTLGVVPIPDEVFEGTVDTIIDAVEDFYNQEGDDALYEELDENIADLYDLSDSEMVAMEDFVEFFVAD